MKVKCIILCFTLLLISCKREQEKNSKINVSNRSDKIIELSKQTDDVRSRNDTIDFITNYVYNLTKVKSNYLKNENIICFFKDSIEIKNVSSAAFAEEKIRETDFKSNFDDKIFIDFENFTLSFASNYDSEMYCEVKKIIQIGDIFIINIYLNDNILTCILDSKQKKYQIVLGETILVNNDLLLISSNEENIATVKILKIKGNSIVCENKFFSKEDSFYGFYYENNILNFLSTKKNITKKYSLTID